MKVAAGSAAAGVVAAAVAAGVVLSTRGNGTPAQTSHAAYAALWASTHVGDRTAAVLARWPKPYQTYGDNFKDRCYEWWDKPQYLYNLCFRKGVVVTKDIG